MKTWVAWVTLVGAMGGCRRAAPAVSDTWAPPPVDTWTPPDVPTRSVHAPDRAAIPEGTNWWCSVADRDGGLVEDVCYRTDSACRDAVERNRVETMGLNRQLASLGIARRMTENYRCVGPSEAQCLTYLDTRDGQTHFSCVRTAGYCSRRRQYFHDENARVGSVVRYRSISDCEETP